MPSAEVSLIMRIFGIRTEVASWVPIVVAVAVVILPLRWLVAMVLAAVVHELGHLLALRFSDIKVDRLSIGLTGARIVVGPLTPRQELLCACAGPGAGALLIGLGRIYPELAVCAFVQSVYNLVPMMPFDGGRILRCGAEELFPPQWSERILLGTEFVICCGIFCVGVFCLLHHFIFAAFLAMVFVLFRVKGKITCKGEASAVQ